MGAAPIFAATPATKGVLVNSVSTTHRSAPSAPFIAFTAGAAGARVDRIIVRATATTAAGTFTIFYDDTSAVFLMEELAVAALTVGAGIPGWEGESIKITPEKPLILAANHRIKVATDVNAVFAVTVVGGSF